MFSFKCLISNSSTVFLPRHLHCCLCQMRMRLHNLKNWFCVQSPPMPGSVLLAREQTKCGDINLRMVIGRRRHAKQDSRQPTGHACATKRVRRRMVGTREEERLPSRGDKEWTWTRARATCVVSCEYDIHTRAELIGDADLTHPWSYICQWIMITVRSVASSWLGKV
jgi:hypothetical protein